MEVLRKKEVVIVFFISLLSSHISVPFTKVRLTDTNTWDRRPFIIDARIIYLPRYDILLGYVSCNRCHISASSGFKTGFRYCTTCPTKGGPFSLSLPGLSIVLRKP